jgi:hypothetical protein
MYTLPIELHVRVSIYLMTSPPHALNQTFMLQPAVLEGRENDTGLVKKGYEEEPFGTKCNIQGLCRSTSAWGDHESKVKKKEKFKRLVD